jgi:hypothetical protein
MTQQTPERPDVDELVRVVLAVPGVHELHAGVLGEAATYLPGRRVNGLKLLDPGCEIHLVVESGVPLLATADLVRAAVRSHVEGPIDVTIEDLVVAPAPGSVEAGAPVETETGSETPPETASTPA